MMLVLMCLKQGEQGELLIKEAVRILKEETVHVVSYEECVLEKFEKYDLIILDTQFMDIARQVRMVNQNCFLIFVGKEFQDIFEAFRLKTFQYLPSYVSDEILERVLLRAQYTYKKKNAECVLYTKEGEKHFKPKDIMYIETRNRELVMGTVYGTFFGKVRNLMKMKSELDDFHFAQVHQSYFLNMNFILSIKKGEVTLRNGEKIPTSITYRDKVKEKIDRFLVTP